MMAKFSIHISDVLKKRKYASCAIALLAISLATHFAYFNRQKVSIFDEVHFGSFANGYLTHEYFFDIHPPLGKLMIAGFVLPFQSDKVEFSLNQPGNPTPNFAVYRFLPALFGSFLALAIFLIALELGIKPFGAFFAGFLVAIENSIIAHSRLILIDSIFLCFGFFGLWMYLKYRTTRKFRWILAAGLLCGASLSVKWMGLSFLGLIVSAEIIRLIKQKTSADMLKKTVFALAIVPLFIYVLTFAIHFGLLTKTGPGDVFMSPAFQSSLEGNNISQNSIKKLGFWDKFIELNHAMYSYGAAITTPHPYSSRWYGWPLMQKPIAYYQNGQSIYFSPNPIIWLSGICAVAITLILLALRPSSRSFEIYFLLGGFIVNWLIFSLIGRTTFLYHYLAALLFSIIILAWLVNRAKRSSLLYLIIGSATTVGFLYYAPLTYGL